MVSPVPSWEKIGRGKKFAGRPTLPACSLRYGFVGIGIPGLKRETWGTRCVW